MDADALMKTKWFPELLAQVGGELRRMRAAEEDAGPALEAELAAADKEARGLRLSLADPDLKPAVRAVLSADLDAALCRQADLGGRLTDRLARAVLPEDLVDAAAVAAHLARLADVLSEANPSRANLELSLHIDRIDCRPDGTVAIRTCKLGALAKAAGVLATRPEIAIAGGIRPRRRRRVWVDGLGRDAPAARAAAEAAADPERFAGLGPEWFWLDTFRVPEPTYWAQANARAVGDKRKETGWTVDQLAEFFRKTPPTIRKALDIARQADPELAALPRKMPRSRWEDAHYPEVAELRARGLSVKEIGEHFDISPPIIRKAIALAERQLPDGGGQTQANGVEQSGGPPEPTG